MSNVYFKASLQNTLNPEVGTFDNVDNKEGTFTLEDGEYYLTNNTSTSYRVYYPTKDIYSIGFTIEFDINYNDKSDDVHRWCLLFNGDDYTYYWCGFGVIGKTLQFRGFGLPNYDIATSPSTWLHVKCTFDYDYDFNRNNVHIYIDNVEVSNFTISNNYYIKYINILGNSIGYVADAKIKNIIIYENDKKHYLDTTGLTLLWSKIKSFFATKTELASKANDSDVVHKSGDETIASTKTFSKPIAGSVTGSSGSCTGNAATATTATTAEACTGNAATATKLATARTIALSGAATGTATSFDGSGNITIPVTALAASAIRAQWYAAFPDGAEAHNAMWGGRDITAAFDDGSFSASVADGTFRDIFPGDYITKQVTISGTAYTVNWVIADCDYWINKGDTAMTAHHVVIVPQQPIFKARMNATNTTEGGYAGSRMYTETIPACATGIVSAFGSDHILTFRDSIVEAVNTSSISSGVPFWTGASSGWGWYDAQCNLMSERMVYGMPAFSSSAWEAGAASRQMSAFRLSEKAINYNRQTWWLRDIVSSAHFAGVNGNGGAYVFNASYSLGVRPFALLC